MDQVIIVRKTRGNSNVETIYDQSDDDDQMREDIKRQLREAVRMRGQGFFTDAPIHVYSRGTAHEVNTEEDIDQLVDSLA